MKKGEAKPHYQKGIFCIRLLKEPSAREYQDIVLGIDPGSKREGYTVATKKAVVLNITTNTPDHVKKNMETRRILRRNRRCRKTPYRVCRSNRATLRKKGRIPPSTKARWDAKLRITKQLLKIIPITIVNVEDIQAVTKAGKPAWNKSFSPLEVGKSWFYGEIKKLEVNLLLTQGIDTKKHRDARGFTKSQAKLDYTWDAHNVDSHSLSEIALGMQVIPYLKLYKLEFLRLHRRALHLQVPANGGARRSHGGTVSNGIPRGTVFRHKAKLHYLGGHSKRGMSAHDMVTGDRPYMNVKVSDVVPLYRSAWRIALE